MDPDRIADDVRRFLPLSGGPPMTAELVAKKLAMGM